MILGVRLFALDLAGSTIASLADLLSDEERTRAAQFRFDADRRRFIARRGQTRLLLAGYVDRLAPDLMFEMNAFDKPALRDGGSLAFNLSSSGDFGVCVVARGIEVGCDIERRDAALAEPAVADRLFAPAESRALAALPADDRVDGFFRCWTRKEAFVKALGAGLSHPLHDFVVSVEPGTPAVVREPSRGWTLHAFAPLPGYHAAVAVPREGVAIPPACWFDAQEALLPSASGWSSGAAGFGTESSISAALFSCAASSAVTPPTP